MKHFINISLAFALIFTFMGCGSSRVNLKVISAPCLCLTDQEIIPEVIEVVNPVPITTTKLNEVIFFPYDSSEITADEMVKINKIVELLTEYIDTKVLIGAYASIEGSFDHNLNLSCDRGDAVTDTLIAKGINADRITTIAYGETNIFGKLLKENRCVIVVNSE